MQVKTLKDLHCQLNEEGIKLFYIPRNQIEQCDTALLLRFLRLFLKDELRGRGARDHIDLAMDGYDDDNRWLHEIAEVRAYFRALDEAFPYWFRFLNKERESLHVLFNCMITLTKVRRGVPAPHDANIFDGAEVREWMRHHYAALDELASRLRIDRAERLEVGRQVEEYFMRRHLRLTHEGKTVYSGERFFADPLAAADENKTEYFIN